VARGAENDLVPEISRFHGIVVCMYHREHGPPHLHARHGEHEVVLALGSRAVTGRLPGNALRLLLSWSDRHEFELRRNWELAAAGKPLQPIEPLE
jgi:hypothetical protein